MRANKSIRRPALNYYGGKWNLAPWIISHFPKHTGYLEPCFGAGSVLLRKPRAPIETVNDLNGEIVNYFQVLRDRPDDLIEALSSTPYAEAEYRNALDGSPVDDPIEMARRLYFKCFMAIGGGPVPTGGDFRIAVDTGVRTFPPSIDRVGLRRIAARLLNVTILDRDALAVIDRYKRDPATLIYFDPPYVLETRTASKRYGPNDFTDRDHVDAADLLNQAAGYVVVSGYDCDLYQRIYTDRGWRRYGVESMTNGLVKKHESIWLNRAAVSALGRGRQARLL